MSSRDPSVFSLDMENDDDDDVEFEAVEKYTIKINTPKR
jgi:hypothetical protein